MSEILETRQALSEDRLDYAHEILLREKDLVERQQVLFPEVDLQADGTKKMKRWSSHLEGISKTWLLALSF
jgi:hypothetical protein